MQFLESLNAGEVVIAVMLGNSVGMGYNADGYEAISGLYNESRGFAVEHRTSDLPDGVSRMLRQFLKTKNPQSELVNLSGDGWDTNDHLGITLPSSSAPPHASSEIILKALEPKPAVVFLPLQINDANHEISVPVFAANTRRLVSFIQGQGIEAVIVKENDTGIKDYPRYIACAGEIARDMGVDVIDTYTPTRNRKDLMSDYAHPNQEGHKVMFEQYKAWMISGGENVKHQEPNADACS